MPKRLTVLELVRDLLMTTDLHRPVQVQINHHLDYEAAFGQRQEDR